MRARELRRWMIEAGKLTPCQREQVLVRLQEGAAKDAVTAVLRSREPPAACPKCQNPRIVRNGQADGLQRFKCRGCGASFNALTGTPLARLRQRAKWLLQAAAMDEGLSVRKAAARMGVHRTTAFRWRHRFLAVPRDAKDGHLTGVVEADETYVLRSYKGQRDRLLADGSRGPHRRGGHAAKRGLSEIPGQSRLCDGNGVWDISVSNRSRAFDVLIHTQPAFVAMGARGGSFREPPNSLPQGFGLLIVSTQR